MTDREKMIELLTDLDCNAEYCKDCEFTKDIDGCVRRKIEIIVDHLLANGVTFATDTNVGGKWIPVTERLPEFDLKVLVYGGDRPVMDYGRLKKSPCVYTGRIGGLDEGWLTWDESAYIENVTHWMPLPEPPKGE